MVTAQYRRHDSLSTLQAEQYRCASQLLSLFTYDKSWRNFCNLGTVQERPKYTDLSHGMLSSVVRTSFNGAEPAYKVTKQINGADSVFRG